MPTKLPGIGTTIFTVMTELANRYGALNLSQGFPDFDVPEQLITLVSKYMHAGKNQYAPMQGVLELREGISRKVKRLYGGEYDPQTDITITAGATEALFAAITAVVNPGDEVLIFEPAYDSYEPAVILSGGVTVPVKLTIPDYRIDWDRVADLISPKTRLIILNSPHNPTGMVLSDQDIATLADILENRNVFLLSDEVYEHILFDGRSHASLSRNPALAARSFVVSSFGKTYHSTGWKIGYCLAPETMSAEFRKVHQFLTFAVNTPVQYAYAEFLENTAWEAELASFYQQKRDLFLAHLNDSRFKPIPCGGTYFQMLDYSAISDEPDTRFAERLIREHGVAAIPPSVFYRDKDDHKQLRFCFAKKDDTLIQAAERLCRI